MKTSIKIVFLMVATVVLCFIASPVRWGYASFVHGTYSGPIISYEESHYGLVLTVYDESRPWREDGIRILVTDQTELEPEAAASITARETGINVVVNSEHWGSLFQRDIGYPAVDISLNTDEITEDTSNE